MRIETNRLILREFTLDDLDAFASLMEDPVVMRFSVGGPMKKEQVAEYLQKRILNHYAQYGYGLYAIIHKADNCFIGYIGLLDQTIDGENKLELGYRLNPGYWGQGLASEAAAAICRYTFETLGKDELISIIEPQNVRSLNVAKRIGMHYWREAMFHNIPVHIYALRNIAIRNLLEEDIEKLVETFTAPWSTSESTLNMWLQFFQEQEEGIRTVCLLEYQNRFLGYGSLLRSSRHLPFQENGIPEISALWVEEPSRRQGLGTKLIEHLEEMARQENYKTIGIGVGLYKDYGQAQKLYSIMGYKPDGNGITYKHTPVVPGTAYPVDDDLILWLSKPLNSLPQFRFKLVEKADRPLVHAWLKEPHVTEWFYGEGLQNTFKHLDAFLEGSPFAQYWLALDQNHPFAFFITSHVDKPHDELTSWCLEDGKTITLDMLIGDTAYLGKGYAAPLIRQFLLSQFPDTDAVLIDPEASNMKAIHVYQKAGFRKVGDLIPSHSPHPHIMMKLHLSSNKGG